MMRSDRLFRAILSIGERVRIIVIEGSVSPTLKLGYQCNGFVDTAEDSVRLDALLTGDKLVKPLTSAYELRVWSSKPHQSHRYF
jgi:hypothetical protein